MSCEFVSFYGLLLPREYKYLGIAQKSTSIWVNVAQKISAHNYKYWYSAICSKLDDFGDFGKHLANYISN